VQFELLRLSLVARNQGDLFREPAPDRRQALRAIFSNRHRFPHRKGSFEYIPRPDIQIDGNAIVGRMGRLTSELAYMPPEHRLDEYYEERWVATDLVLRISDDPKSDQIVAVERKHDLGKPLPILESFAAYVNRKRHLSGTLRPG
jgi:hypothetical protein